MNVLTRCAVFHHCLVSKPTTPSFGFLIKFKKSVSLNRNYASLRHTKLQNVMQKRTMMNDSEHTQKFIDVTAYATSDEYKFDSLKNHLKSATSLKELPEDAMDVLHVELKFQPSELFKGYFLFREGSVVFWNCTEDEKAETLKLLTKFQVAPYEASLVDEQSESLVCRVAEGKSALVNGDIHLQMMEGNSFNPLEMLAFSNAISHSVKLAIWEAFLDKDVTSNKSLLEDLKKGRKLRVSMDDVLKRCGRLYNLRHHINLGSSLLDSPDFYWDRSNLEKLYLKTCQFLNIPLRTRVINEKLHHSVEFVELIRDHLKDKHHTRLELMIIFLIMIEVFFGSCHFLEKYFFTGKDQIEK